MTYMSIGWAVSIRVANFMGTFNMSGIRRISRAGVHIILVMATFTSIIFYFFTGNLVTVFTPEPGVVAAALPLVIPLILYQYCDGVQLTYVNALRGTPVVKPLLWISIFSYIVVGIPIMVVLAVPLGLEAVGVYYSFSVALFVATVLLMTAFNRTLKREEAKIEEKKESC